MMDDDNDDNPNDSDKGAGDAGYAVGFGKPPREHRFKPGNQAARKKREAARKKNTASLTDAIAKALQRPLKVRRGEKLVDMTAADLLADRLVQTIARGNTRELIAVMALIKEHAPETLKASVAAMRVEYHRAEGSTVALPPADLYEPEEPS